jgi:hypothetical protein
VLQGGRGNWEEKGKTRMVPVIFKPEEGEREGVALWQKEKEGGVERATRRREKE